MGSILARPSDARSSQDRTQQIDGDREVVVALIGGVDSNGQPVYGDVTSTDPEFQDNFGIGPGCTGPGLEPVGAVPPVRMRDVAEGYDGGSLYSVCESDYGAALSDIASRILAQI